MLRMALASLLFATACSAAHADQQFGPNPPPGTSIAIGIAPVKVRAPYDVQLLRGNGDTLPTYGQRDRFYVQGNAGERYTIRITNPTARRVEAVVTVDGLDVIDGSEGDLRKRGYIVPPYGETRIEGFRTSQADVATFRFSSVDGSYAGRQGKARNVGVIAVALFEEQAAPPTEIIVGEVDETPYGHRRGGGATGPKVGDVRMSENKEVAPARNRGPAGVARRPDPVAPAPRPPRDWDGEDRQIQEEPPMRQDAPRTHRPGLGTEFGEQRYSAASFTRFVRATDRPIAIAELRYNNAAGLAALGINAEPLPDQGEIMTRETADPFPGDHRFSTPPR
jgi:hypothetical protein